ncbi:hypothetical protein ANCDUO_16179 [Ancylostoma duodenale]|uniref:Uncharacterized protein n=1 Tax=Ancylostoma duodenale TaxID=51022 RepID=A0A0C2CBI7_9BILA|nr:hypothetical protein ANCDUO_16179 [Ancylostoma duodenale]
MTGVSTPIQAISEKSWQDMFRGYGFVSEECPTAAVGCRIKARSDHVEWYEWSKLYDRNQLVCVYPGEYEGTAGMFSTTSAHVIQK